MIIEFFTYIFFIFYSFIFNKNKKLNKLFELETEKEIQSKAILISYISLFLLYFDLSLFSLFIIIINLLLFYKLAYIDSKLTLIISVQFFTVGLIRIIFLLLSFLKIFQLICLITPSFVIFLFFYYYYNNKIKNNTLIYLFFIYSLNIIYILS